MESKIITPDLYKQYVKSQMSPLTRATGNLSLQQFFDLMFYTLDIENPNIVIAPAFPQYLIPGTEDYNKTMDNPSNLFRDTVTYIVTREEPGNIGGDKQPFGSGHRELRHRVRDITEGSVDGKSRIQYGKWFDTLVQFDLWTLTNVEAETMVLWFKRFMETHRDFFKEMGLSEVFFWWRGRDSVSAQLNNKLHLRSIVYFIRTEELSYEEDYNLKELQIQLEKVITK